MADKKKIPPGVQSVARALDILELLGRLGPTGVSDIARQLDLHVATVHNLLRTLAGRHYLLNDGGQYRLGPAAGLLAGQFDALAALPERVRPALENIAQATGECASATVLVGTEAHLISFVPGTESVTIHFPQRVWPQALDLATGRVLVALTRPDNWDDFIAAGSKTQPRWSAKRWRRELSAIASAGHAWLTRKPDGGQLAMALPLRTRTGEVIAAIGAACPGFRATPAHAHHMFTTLVDAAETLSASFGWKADSSPSPAEPDWADLPNLGAPAA